VYLYLAGLKLSSLILQSALKLIQEQIQADLPSGCVLSVGGLYMWVTAIMQKHNVS